MSGAMPGVPAVKESMVTEILTMKEGFGLIAIVDDNIKDTSSNNNRIMVDDGSDSSDGEKESVT